MRTRTYEEAVRLLSRLQSNSAVLSHVARNPAINARSLPEMRAWLHRAGHTESDLEGLRCIHVTGTKGKGSVCSYAASLLREWNARSGTKAKVGLYTSPHLVTIRERIVVDGEIISQGQFARYFFEVWDAIQASKGAGVGPMALNGTGPEQEQDMPGLFRFLTLMAFHAFLREEVREAVIECGIGGEYDATNILPAKAVSASVVTSIGLDHVEVLGYTPLSVAWHKGGIFKPGVPAVIGSGLPGGVKDVLLDRKAERDGGARGCLLEEVPGEIGASRWLEARGLSAVLETEPKRTWEEVDARNKALALAAVLKHTGLCRGPGGRATEAPGLPVGQLPVEVLRALQCGLRGRKEVIERDSIKWLLDGAHTPESICTTASWLTATLDTDGQAHGPGSWVLVFNQQDTSRSSEGLLRALKLGTDPSVWGRLVGVVFTRNDLAPSLEGGEVRDTSVQAVARTAFLQHVVGADSSGCAGGDASRKQMDGERRVKTHITDNVQDAIQLATSLADDLPGQRLHVLVTGSFHLVGGMIRFLDGVGDSVV